MFVWDGWGVVGKADQMSEEWLRMAEEGWRRREYVISRGGDARPQPTTSALGALGTGL